MHGLKIGSPLMSFFFSAHKTYNNTTPNNKHHSHSNLHPISLEEEKRFTEAIERKKARATMIAR
jgi:hypothetical protein